MRIDHDNLYAETRKALASINDGEFPEAYEYLDGTLDDAGGIAATPFEIATALVGCDKPKKFPAFLVEYITSLYEYEIELGNINAMNDLGCQYYDGGRGWEQSFDRAVHFYKLAADNGNRQAMKNLGYCYYYGRNMEPDYEKAFQLLCHGSLQQTCTCST